MNHLVSHYIEHKKNRLPGPSPGSATEGFMPQRCTSHPTNSQCNPHPRARNNGRSTDNVRTDCGFDRSNFRLVGHVDRSKFNRIENEINLRFLLFSCYLSSRCGQFHMRQWNFEFFKIKFCTMKLNQQKAETMGCLELLRSCAFCPCA